VSLTFGFTSILDLFEKLKRGAVLLDEKVTSDRFFNFVITGYTMIDWVKNDSTIPATISKQSVVEEELYKDEWLKICRDIATASKHFKLNTRKPITSSATSSQGFGAGRFGKGGFGTGEEGIKITLDDGTTFNCLDLAQNVIRTWQLFIMETTFNKTMLAHFSLIFVTHNG